MSSFSLITLSYQSGTHTQRCLEALLAQGATEIIHADNGSSDIDLRALKARFPSIIQVDNGENLGFAAGMNRAAAQAKGDWLGFINPDAFAESHWLDAMRAAIIACPDTHIFTALQLDADNPTRMDGAGDALTGFGFPYRAGFGQPVPADLQLAEVFAPCGAAFVIHRDLFEALGGFDERLFCYCEDADLGFRARLRGERTVFVPEAIVHHVGSASLGVRSDFALWHGYRNRFWLFVKNMPLVLLVATLPLHIGMTLLMALKDTLKGRAGIVWPALWAGLKGLRPILANRKLIQKTRQISALRLAKTLTWSPLKIARRDPDHRRLT